MQEIFSPDQNYVVVATKIIGYLDLSSLFTCRSVSKVGILCLNFPSILSNFLSQEKLTQKWQDPKAEQITKLQRLNYKIDQNVESLELSVAFSCKELWGSRQCLNSQVENKVLNTYTYLHNTPCFATAKSAIELLDKWTYLLLVELWNYDSRNLCGEKGSYFEQLYGCC